MQELVHEIGAATGCASVVGAAAYVVTQPSGDGSADPRAHRVPERPKRHRAAVKPGNVTVAVLNSTTVPGLAAALRDQVAAADKWP